MFSEAKKLLLLLALLTLISTFCSAIPFPVKSSGNHRVFNQPPHQNEPASNRRIGFVGLAVGPPSNRRQGIFDHFEGMFRGFVDTLGRGFRNMMHFGGRMVHNIMRPVIPSSPPPSTFSSSPVSTSSNTFAPSGPSSGSFIPASGPPPPPPPSRPSSTFTSSGNLLPPATNTFGSSPNTFTTFNQRPLNNNNNNNVIFNNGPQPQHPPPRFPQGQSFPPTVVHVKQQLDSAHDKDPHYRDDVSYIHQVQSNTLYYGDTLPLKTRHNAKKQNSIFNFFKFK